MEPFTLKSGMTVRDEKGKTYTVIRRKSPEVLELSPVVPDGSNVVYGYEYALTIVNTLENLILVIDQFDPYYLQGDDDRWVQRGREQEERLKQMVSEPFMKVAMMNLFYILKTTLDGD